MSECPPADALVGYLAGRLDLTANEAVETHAEDCAVCQARLEKLSDDGLKGPLLALPQSRPDLPSSLRPLLGSPPGRTDQTAPVSSASEVDLLAEYPVPDPYPSPPAVPGLEMIRELGRGGMGVVYLARQVGLDRLVAVKFILAGLHARPEDLARFHAEAQAAALVVHPNLVQVYHVGEHHGLPYCVMEYVSGGNLGERTAGRAQPPRAAAALVATLADAVQAAHAVGIVHRDLKPENILLARIEEPGGGSEEGTNSLLDPRCSIPKIADFGLAKRLDANVRLTRSGYVVGTPGYMAPEQAAGRDLQVGPTVDVYALGAILYELLTGRPPFQGPGALDTALQVLTREPPSPRRLNPSVPPDLETICLRCLQKEPQRRYPSALDLADDLRRFLDGRPILARPVGSLERLWLWCRRNPLVAGLLAVVAVLVIGSLIGLSVALWIVAGLNNDLKTSIAQERAARGQALRQADQGQQIVENLTSELTRRAFLQGEELTVEQREVLRQAVAYYQQFVAARGQTTDLAGQARQAKAYQQMGAAQRVVNEPRAAVATLREAVDRFERLAREQPDVGQYRDDLGHTYVHLGLALAELKECDAAVQAYRDAVEVQEPLVREQPAKPEYRQDLAETQFFLGQLLMNRGQKDAAGQAYRTALDLQEQLVREHPGLPRYRKDLARTHMHRGLLLQSLGERDGAAQAFGTALDLQEQLVREHPTVTEYRMQLATTRTNRGLLLRAFGQHDEAAPDLRAARDLYEQVAQVYPAAPSYRQKLALGHNNLGLLLKDLGKHEEAAEAFGAALKLREALVKAYPNLAEHRQELASTHYSLAMLFMSMGRNDEAAQAHRTALEQRERLARDHPAVPEFRQQLAASHHNLGVLLRRMGQLDEAALAYRAALPLREQLVREHPAVHDYVVELGNSYNAYGQLLRYGGKPAEAVGWLDKAVTTLQPMVQQEPRLVTARTYLCSAHQARALALNQLGRYADAARDWEQAVALDLARNRPSNRLQLALSLVGAGDHMAATRLAEELAQLKQAKPNPDVTLQLARIFARAAGSVREDRERAESYAARSVALLQRARDEGGFRDKAKRDALPKDPDFAPLAAREDFRRLLTELERPESKQ
jgi:serine/threonine-protein kinase